MPLFPPEVHAADSVIVLSAGSGAVEADTKQNKATELTKL